MGGGIGNFYCAFCVAKSPTEIKMELLKSVIIPYPHMEGLATL
jgi:hypothetical protein